MDDEAIEIREEIISCDDTEREREREWKKWKLVID